MPHPSALALRDGLKEYLGPFGGLGNISAWIRVAESMFSGDVISAHFGLRSLTKGFSAMKRAVK